MVQQPPLLAAEPEIMHLTSIGEEAKGNLFGLRLMISAATDVHVQNLYPGNAKSLLSEPLFFSPARYGLQGVGFYEVKL